MSVEALARVLADLTEYGVDDAAERIIRDPGPLLEALAQAGVLETEHGEKRGEVTHDGGGCFSIHYDPYTRYVSPWKPTGA